jgi:hypothetical protein
MDLGRALVPSANQIPNQIMPMPQGAGLPALPGQPETEEEERALGIRRPAYIPVTSDKPKRKIRSCVEWRFERDACPIAACGANGLFAKIASLACCHRSSRPAHAAGLRFSQAPVTPVSTPGPAAKYIVNVVTARSVDSNFAPIDITSHFPDAWFTVIQVRNLTAGETIPFLCAGS